MVHGIIPARSGSKGVKDKNIKVLRGKPLLIHSIETSLHSKFIDRTYLTTDSDAYIDLIKGYGSNVRSIKRPLYLSNDTACDIDYLLHFVYSYNVSLTDYIVLLRPTTPIRDIVVINKYIDEFIRVSDGYDSLRSMHELSEPPEKMMRLEYDMAVPYMSGINSEEANQSRQSFSKCYHPNGYMDIIKCEVLIKYKQVYWKRIYPLITDRVIEIDSETDFEMLEVLK